MTLFEFLSDNVADPKDDGTYVLNLNHEDTLHLMDLAEKQMELPTPQRPDGCPADAEGTKNWILRRLSSAKEKLWGVHPSRAAIDNAELHLAALEQVQQAEHALRVLIHEQRADAAGVVKQ